MADGLGRWGRGETIRGDDDVKPPSMWAAGKPNPSDQHKVNTQIEEAIKRKQEEMFAWWLEDHGLKDYRNMPYSEQRTEMKHRVFAALYNKEEPSE